MNKKRILLLILVASLKLSNIQSNPIKNLFFKTQTRTFVTACFLGGVINYLAFINYSSNINIFPYLSPVGIFFLIYDNTFPLIHR